MFEHLASPALLLDLPNLEKNISAMQTQCDAHNTQLWPHIKTHKMVQVARRQLAAGAAGLTCAKIGEAEAMLPAFAAKNGPSRLFIAHSLVDVRQAPRLTKLANSLDELVVACTSEAHAPALEAVLASEDLTLPVMMALDTGQGREGARDLDGAVRLAKAIVAQPHLKLQGIYTHEGHLYQATPADAPAATARAHAHLLRCRDAICEALGLNHSQLRLWPGCSVSAFRMAALPEVDAVRPGAYVFGDISQADTTKVMPWDDIALTILATVIDRPAPGLALIDAGSKVFSGDKTSQGLSGRAFDGRDLRVTKVSEEHGFVTGADVDELKIGDRLRFVPAHVCPVLNLADEVNVIAGDEVVECWPVEARGCVR